MIMKRDTHISKYYNYYDYYSLDDILLSHSNLNQNKTLINKFDSKIKMSQ